MAIDFQPKVRRAELSLVPFVHISVISYACEHTAQTCSQADLPTHAQLNHFYLTSIYGITCMISHPRPSRFSVYNIEKLEVANNATISINTTISIKKAVVLHSILAFCPQLWHPSPHTYMILSGWYIFNTKPTNTSLGLQPTHLTNSIPFNYVNMQPFMYWLELQDVMFFID